MDGSEPILDPIFLTTSSAPNCRIRLSSSLAIISKDRPCQQAPKRMNYRQRPPRMDTKFNCQHCSAAIEADTRQVGMAGDCPACGRLIVVPDARTQRRATGGAEFSFIEKRAPGHFSRETPPAHSTPTLPRAIPPRTVSQETKSGADYAADAVCATARGAWKATKFIAPLVGKAAFAVANVGVKVTKRAVKVIEPEPPGKWTQRARVGAILWRWLTG